MPDHTSRTQGYGVAALPGERQPAPSAGAGDSSAREAGSHEPSCARDPVSDVASEPPARMLEVGEDGTHDGGIGGPDFAPSGSSEPLFASARLSGGCERQGPRLTLPRLGSGLQCVPGCAEGRGV